MARLGYGRCRPGHLLIASAAQLPLLSKFLAQLRAFVRMMGIEAVGRPGRMAQVMREHQAIVDALERRDDRAALGALSEHLRATAQVLLTAQTGDGPRGDT